MDTDYKLAAPKDVISNQPVVIDNGSGVLKAGFAGDELPKCLIPSIIGEPKHTKVMTGGLTGETFFGNVAQENRGILKLRHVLEHGIVEDWHDMERLWNYMYLDGLKISPEEHPVLLTESCLNPRHNREKAAELFFETFNVPALFVSSQPILALYASGNTTGIVLDSGDGVTHAVPIVQGYAIPTAITRIDIAGRDVTRYLQVLLRREGYAFHTSAEQQIVRSIKESSLMYVAFKPQLEEENLKKGELELADYKLPDGVSIKVGPARFRAPELLFQPSLIGSEYEGVHECIVNSIRKTDIDVRKKLFSSILLSGGSTLFAGFGNRLLSEVRRLAPKEVKIKILAPPERKYSVWIGGSILASLSTFQQMWLSKADYDEHGPQLLHKKCF